MADILANSTLNHSTLTRVYVHVSMLWMYMWARVLRVHMHTHMCMYYLLALPFLCLQDMNNINRHIHYTCSLVLIRLVGVSRLAAGTPT